MYYPFDFISSCLFIFRYNIQSIYNHMKIKFWPSSFLKEVEVYFRVIVLWTQIKNFWLSKKKWRKKLCIDVSRFQPTSFFIVYNPKSVTITLYLANIENSDSEYLFFWITYKHFLGLKLHRKYRINNKIASKHEWRNVFMVA